MIRVWKAIRIALVMLGICGLVAGFWYRSGENDIENGTVQWIEVGLSASPLYRYEEVTRADGEMASFNSSFSPWSLTTLLFFAVVGCFILARKIRLPQSKSTADPQ